jgi:hypothetical protein
MKIGLYTVPYFSNSVCFLKCFTSIILVKLHNYMYITPCSIRRRALDLLYGMCDVTNAKEIVEELLQVYNIEIVVSQMKNKLRKILRHVICRCHLLVLLCES